MNAKTMKGLITKLAVTGALAGAVVLASPTQAQAQGFAIQFGVGHPSYAPAYGPGFYAEQRRDDFIRHEEFLRHERWEHERWEREHAFGPVYPGRGYAPAYGVYRR